MIAKEHRRRGFVLTSMDFNNRAYFYWLSITNLMNNIEYRERFWIWLLEPIACNRNLTLGYKKNTIVEAEANYMQLLTIHMFVPKLWCVYMTRCRENYKRPGMVNKDLEYCTFYHQLNVIPNLVHIGSVISEK